jgi:hypothetical protein
MRRKEKSEVDCEKKSLSLRSAEKKVDWCCCPVSFETRVEVLTMEKRKMMRKYVALRMQKRKKIQTTMTKGKKMMRKRK